MQTMNGRSNISLSGNAARSGLSGARLSADRRSRRRRGVRELGPKALRRGTRGRTLVVAALLAGIAVVGAITASRSGFLDPTATKVALGLSITAFFGLSFAAIGRHDARRPRRADRHEIEDDAADPAANDDGPGEALAVYLWRKSRLRSLGVPDTAAELLSIDRCFSVSELERLLAVGCPLDTALRIVWPIS